MRVALYDIDSKIPNLGLMPFNKRDLYQSRFARWVNHRATFKTVSWEKYRWDRREVA
jgi:hypothetical protein